MTVLFVFFVPILALTMAMYYQVSFWTRLQADIRKDCRDSSLVLQNQLANEVSNLMQSMNSETMRLHLERQVAEAEAAINPTHLMQVTLRQIATDRIHQGLIESLKLKAKALVPLVVSTPVWHRVASWRARSQGVSQMHWDSDEFRSGNMNSVKWQIQTKYFSFPIGNFGWILPGQFYEPAPDIKNSSRMDISVVVRTQPWSTPGSESWLHRVRSEELIQQPLLISGMKAVAVNDRDLESEFLIQCSSSIEEVMPMIFGAFVWKGRGVLQWPKN